MARYRIDYYALAALLAELSLTATCADLIVAVEAYLGDDTEYKDKLLVGVRALPPETEWLRGLFCLCEALKKDNPRFIPALFMDWALIDK